VSFAASSAIDWVCSTSLFIDSLIGLEMNLVQALVGGAGFVAEVSNWVTVVIKP
jgi:hypothetical protein